MMVVVVVVMMVLVAPMDVAPSTSTPTAAASSVTPGGRRGCPALTVLVGEDPCRLEVVVTEGDGLVERHSFLAQLLVLQGLLHHPSQLAQLGFHVHHPLLGLFRASGPGVEPAGLGHGGESGGNQVWSLTQFYSVDFSQSMIGVSKCVFYKRTIKVCVSC